MKLSQHFGMQAPFDQHHKFVTSPVFSSPVLAAIRLIFAIYTLFVLIFVLVYQTVVLKIRGEFFSYFTQLTQIGLCAYFWAAAVQTILYVRHQRTWYPLQRWPRFLQFLHILLHSSIIVYPILVSIVYWVLLADSETLKGGLYSVFSTVSLHLLNSVYALFEIFLTNTPPSPWLLLLPLELMLAGYLGVAYITHATQGWYPYSFLNPATKSAGALAGYIVGVAAGGAFVFVVVKYLMVLRQWIAIRTGRLYIHGEETMASGAEKARASSPESLSDWQAVEAPKNDSAV